MSAQDFNRRDFMKATGVAAAAAASTALPGAALAASGEPESSTRKHNPGELIPGMREQGKKIKRVYCESDYAPLRAALVGNPSEIILPDPTTWEFRNLFKNEGAEFMAYMHKHGGKRLQESDPETYEKMAMESDALADAFRKEGVQLIRNDTGKTPRNLIEYNTAWSGQRQFTLFGQSAFEVFGNVLVSMWEVSCSNISELAHREALNEVFKNDKDAIWLSMPALYPTADGQQPGPWVAPGDPIMFSGKNVIVGIGIENKSDINNPSARRSSGDEFGAEMLQRMLRPFGWTVHTVYFDSRATYHIDCLMSVLEEGLIGYPKGTLLSPLPDFLKDWEVFDISMEDHKLGCSNNEPLGNKRLVCPAGTKDYARNLEKRGWTCIEVPYATIYDKIGSGIHCSTAAIWRES
jgi:hypothetical protein